MEIDYIRVYQEQPLSIDQNNPSEIQLYPNPTSKRFFIDSTIEIDEVNIYDLHGRLVVKQQPMQKEISVVEDLSKGVYLVEIKALDLQSTRRLIVK
ncbi:MAG TPA: hypothetical protein DCF89_13820 [Flavobacteriales bacterium]|nr:hypothetical protein [Flavobacteriales bacterium]